MQEAEALDSEDPLRMGGVVFVRKPLSDAPKIKVFG